MSEITGAGPRWGHRWRAVYDVVLGVVLFVSLLLPAARQASTGTLAGLRNGMLLLLVDVVVLVMLSRYITSPSRAERLRRSAPAPEEVLSLERAAALLDERGAPRDVAGLTLSDVGIAVHQAGSSTHASLAWSDCAAVVHSQVTLANGTTFAYLQFVALHEERIRRGTGDERSRALARLLGLTESAAAMVWVAPAQLVRLPPLVLGFVERQHPEVRVVRPDVVDRAE